MNTTIIKYVSPYAISGSIIGVYLSHFVYINNVNHVYDNKNNYSQFEKAFELMGYGVCLTSGAFVGLFMGVPVGFIYIMNKDKTYSHYDNDRKL